MRLAFGLARCCRFSLTRTQNRLWHDTCLDFDILAIIVALGSANGSSNISLKHKVGVHNVVVSLVGGHVLGTVLASTTSTRGARQSAVIIVAKASSAGSAIGPIAHPVVAMSLAFGLALGNRLLLAWAKVSRGLFLSFGNLSGSGLNRWVGSISICRQGHGKQNECHVNDGSHFSAKQLSEEKRRLSGRFCH